MSTTAGGQRQLAGFWIRFAAFTADVFIVILPLSIVTGALLSLVFGGGDRWDAYAHGWSEGADWDDWHGYGRGSYRDGWDMWPQSMVISGIYFTLMESSSWQATLGKRMMRVMVVDYEGRRLERRQALYRWFSCLFSWLTLGIGYAMIGLTERRQGLHDKIAKTLVVRRDVPSTTFGTGGAA